MISAAWFHNVHYRIATHKKINMPSETCDLLQLFNIIDIMQISLRRKTAKNNEDLSYSEGELI